MRLEAGEIARLVGPDATGAPPAEQVALRPILAGDLVLRSALVDERGTELRQFTLNVETGHMPPGLPTTSSSTSTSPPGATASARSPRPPRPRRRRARHRARRPGWPGSCSPASSWRASPGTEDFGGAEAVPVVLNLSPGQVITMVRAVAEGQVDLVRQLGRTAAAPVPTVQPSDDAAPSSAPAQRTPAPAAS